MSSLGCCIIKIESKHYDANKGSDRRENSY